MVTGTSTISNANFYPFASQIVGIERITAGGTPGQPYVNSIGHAVNTTPSTITLNSTNILDTSTYRVAWINPQKLV